MINRFHPSPLGDARVWSHATYWHGIRKRMTEFAALKEAVLWLWRVHREIVPTHTELEFRGYNFQSKVFWISSTSLFSMLFDFSNNKERGLTFPSPGPMMQTLGQWWNSLMRQPAF